VLTVPGGVRIYLACGATDMRRGFDSLSVMAQEVLKQDPFCGAVFCFRGATVAAVADRAVRSLVAQIDPLPAGLGLARSRCEPVPPPAVSFTGGFRTPAIGAPACCALSARGPASETRHNCEHNRQRVLPENRRFHYAYVCGLPPNCYSPARLPELFGPPEREPFICSYKSAGQEIQKCPNLWPYDICLDVNRVDRRRLIVV
jgi:hypothetical protein